MALALGISLILMFEFRVIIIKIIIYFLVNLLLNKFISELLGRLVASTVIVITQ